jgi:RNA polymerase sigma factor (sigma-70 family)
MGEVIQQLRKTLLQRDAAGLSDGQLLDSFINCREEAAIGALVRRHGPMVWGVCRRILGHHQDAEDAFQATFVVLVRKAATVRPREMIANWLHGVAYQTARKAAQQSARHRVRTRPMDEIAESQETEHNGTDDLLALLDQEVQHLPEKYRRVIVLCELEGRTRKEAARQLKVPEGTVAGRLVRARALLGKRLSRYGTAVATASLATLLSTGDLSAAVPPTVLTATIRATESLAGGTATSGLISAHANSLARVVLKRMLLAKLKVPLCLALLLALTWGLGAHLSHGAPGGGTSVTQSRAVNTSAADATGSGRPTAAPPVARPDPFMLHLHKVVVAHLIQLYKLVKPIDSIPEV